MRPTLALLLMLGGCSAYQVREARQDILGMSAPDLLACAGVPDKVQQLSGHALMIQYDRAADHGSLLSIKALNIADISLGRSGACHAHSGSCVMAPSRASASAARHSHSLVHTATA